MTFRSVRASSGSLSLDVIRKAAPSVFASEPHSRTSSRYGFVPTVDVVEALSAQGMRPVFASQTTPRDSSRHGHARHLLRFRPDHAPLIVGEAVPEVVLVNSHDGSSGFSMHLGLFRLVCSNGMVVADASLQAVRVSHRVNAIEHARTKSLDLISRTDEVVDVIERFRSSPMSETEAVRFAGVAIRERWGDAAPEGLRPERLVEARRDQDAAANMWAVLNTIQENITKGGVSLQRSGRQSSTRELRSVSEDLRFNAGVWAAADRFLQDREQEEDYLCGMAY
jgi:hypothetical protein